MKDKKLTEITEHYLKMSKGGVGVGVGISRKPISATRNSSVI